MSEMKTPARAHGNGTDVLPARRRFTVDEYYRMGEAGILREDERVELINGEIVCMAPIGSPHAYCVDLFTQRLVLGLAGRALVRVQNPLHLSSGAEPQPDLALLRLPAARYATAHPRPEDAFLVVEVSDTTLAYDRGAKLPLYAQAGIPEVWIADLEGSAVLVCREPDQAAGVYRRMETVTRGGTVSPAAFPDLVLQVGEFLPSA
jgi:Uma2 family endonuclease